MTDWNKNGVAGLAVGEAFGAAMAFETLINPKLYTGGPELTITMIHSGNFSLGQQDAFYTITVSNTGSAPSNGTVTLADILPAGLAWPTRADQASSSRAVPGIQHASRFSARARPDRAFAGSPEFQGLYQ